MSRRGWLLLECVVALALLVGSGAAVASLLATTLESTRRARDVREAVVAAQNALARIEAGLGTPETLSGPVRTGEGFEGGADQVEAKWVLRFEVSPSRFAGLTEVTAEVRAAGADAAAEPVAAIRQLVRLRALGASAAEGDR